jgi:hypothetical protein
MTSATLTNSPWSEHPGSDMAAVRADAERIQHANERLRAIRVIAAVAHDTSDARELLSMLGLETEDIQAARSHAEVAA